MFEFNLILVGFYWFAFEFWLCFDVLVFWFCLCWFAYLVVHLMLCLLFSFVVCRFVLVCWYYDCFCVLGFMTLRCCACVDWWRCICCAVLLILTSVNVFWFELSFLLFGLVTGFGWLCYFVVVESVLWVVGGWVFFMFILCSLTDFVFVLMWWALFCFTYVNGVCGCLCFWLVCWRVCFDVLLCSVIWLVLLFWCGLELFFFVWFVVILFGFLV